MPLKKISRICAYLLLVAIALSIFSGWGITRTDLIYPATFGWINRGVANTIHRGLQIPMAALFLTHVLINIRLNLRNKRSVILNAVLLLIGVVLLTGVILIEQG